MARTDWSTIRSTDFPSIDQFRWTARLCLKKATRPKNEKEKGFFEQAVRALELPEIKILRISDFNTTGVTGPCEEGYPFHALAKSDGVSAKEDLSSGGSFGIGKNAAFALSDIQTAFISTRYKDRVGTEHVLCMEKRCSFHTQVRMERSGVGKAIGEKLRVICHSITPARFRVGFSAAHRAHRFSPYA